MSSKTSNKTRAQGQEQKPVFTGVFTPAEALLQMVDKFGDQLSEHDLRKLDWARWHTQTLAESWASVTSNLSILISEDHSKIDNGVAIGVYCCQDQATPQALQLVSRAFSEIDSLLRLNDLVEERLSGLKGASYD